MARGGRFDLGDGGNDGGYRQATEDGNSGDGHKGANLPRPVGALSTRRRVRHQPLPPKSSTPEADSEFPTSRRASPRLPPFGLIVDTSFSQVQRKVAKMQHPCKSLKKLQNSRFFRLLVACGRGKAHRAECRA